MPETRNFYEYFHRRRVEVLREMVRHERFSCPADVGSQHSVLGLIGINNPVCVDIKRSQSLTVRATAETLPFRDGVFDFLFAGEVLEHIDHPGMAVREWVRVLTSKGKMVVSTPNGLLVSAIGGNPEHKATYAPSEVIRMLHDAGVEVVASKGIYTGLVSGNRFFHLIPFPWIKRWLLRVPVPPPLSYNFVLKARKED